VGVKDRSATFFRVEHHSDKGSLAKGRKKSKEYKKTYERAPLMGGFCGLKGRVETNQGRQAGGWEKGR